MLLQYSSLFLYILQNGQDSFTLLWVFVMWDVSSQSKSNKLRRQKLLVLLCLLLFCVQVHDRDSSATTSMPTVAETERPEQ